jgi:hypothetical protein
MVGLNVVTVRSRRRVTHVAVKLTYALNEGDMTISDHRTRAISRCVQIRSSIGMETKYRVLFYAIAFLRTNGLERLRFLPCSNAPAVRWSRPKLSSFLTSKIRTWK